MQADLSLGGAVFLYQSLERTWNADGIRTYISVSAFPQLHSSINGMRKRHNIRCKKQKGIVHQRKIFRCRINYRVSSSGADRRGRSGF